MTEADPVILIKQDIAVYQSHLDDSGSYVLDWVYLEGDVVLKNKDDFDGLDDIVKIRSIDLHFKQARLKNFDDIKEVDIVYSTWCGESVVAMKVESLNREAGTARGQYLIRYLAPSPFMAIVGNVGSVTVTS